VYFPYLRGKQNELLAVRDCATTINSNGRIVPIIEPVKRNTDDLIRALKHYAEQAVPYILIVNPQVGELAKSHDYLESLISGGQLKLHDGTLLGFIVSEYTSLTDVREFLSLYSDRPVAFIHSYSFTNPQQLSGLMGDYSNIAYHIFIDGTTGNSYRRNFRGYPCALVRDAFKKRKNANYPEDEFFSELHNIYADSNLVGFGDFTIVGAEYTDGGGPAYAVAIHLTYHRDDGDIWIRHFISDRTETPKDPAGKFIEALEKLVEYLDNNLHISYCRACDEFRDLHIAQHFPQLGPIKRLSIKHHIELMSRVLSEAAQI
jgi:hypothetical protein